MADYVDIAVDFEVDVAKKLPPADSAGATPTVAPGRYRVRTIRHWPTKLIPNSTTIYSGDIWYGLEIDGETEWVRAVEVTPVAGQTDPSA